jgi:O-succinylbenzoic acid--CoA ligase
LGGAAAPRALLTRACDRAVPVLTTYGLTEASSQVATRRYADRYAPPAAADRIPTGVPLSSVEVRATGGVLEVRGPTLFSGYLADPASDPLNGWFRTGDLGFVTPDAEVVVTGRESDLIVTGGENVDPLEVELALTALPGVAAACVVGLPDETFGQSVAALIVVGEPSPTSLGALQEELTQRIARHKVPRRLLAVPSLPLLPSGKVDRPGAAALHGAALLELSPARSARNGPT